MIYSKYDIMKLTKELNEKGFDKTLILKKSELDSIPAPVKDRSIIVETRDYVFLFMDIDGFTKFVSLDRSFI